MQEPIPSGTRKKNILIVVALCCLAFSSVLVEIALTKFVAYKVYHHCVYAIISTVILSSGLAGVFVFLNPRLFGADTAVAWSRTAKVALAYSILLPLSVLIFCACPWDPYQGGLALLVRALILPAYFFLFSIPFFFSGVAISHVFVASRVSMRQLYFFDLFFAALGAALCPLSLQIVGGYGTVVLASVLAAIAALCLAFAASAKPNKRILVAIPVLTCIVCVITLAYPSWAMQKWGYDIRSSREKSLKDLVEVEFGGIDKTYWNSIARIDVSKTGSSESHWFTYSLAEKYRKDRLEGRMVLVDGSAPARQFWINGDVRQTAFLGSSLWATPYIINQNPDSVLVIAGGGGLDILVAKFFGIKKVDVIEINPATYSYVLNGGSKKERSGYQDKLLSSEQTSVSIFNAEGRHFCSTRPNGSYDIIQTSAADLCTAVTSGALSFAENHLYTSEAVKDFVRLLRPEGLLSIGHWRMEPPATGIRMLATYLDYLDSQGVKEPWRYVATIGDGEWCDVVMKKTPFQENEMERVRFWAKENGKSIIFDPFQEDGYKRRPSEDIFDRVARAPSKESRLAILSSYSRVISPVTDDKPFFYQGINGIRFDWIYWVMFSAALILSLSLILLPIRKIEKRRLTPALFGLSLFFAMCGIAFLLFELTLMQKLTVFVGGPIYSLSVVLVSVLIGYGLGSLLATRMSLINSKSFLLFSCTVPILLLLLYFVLPVLTAAAMPSPMPVRIAIAILVTIFSSVIVGMPVPVAMEYVKQRYEQAVAWFWGVNSAFNAIGAMSYAILSASLGINAVFLAVALIYLVACLLAARLLIEKPEITDGQ